VVAALVVAFALLAAGCGKTAHDTAISTAPAPAKQAPCRLNRAQRRTVSRALADIRRLRRINARLPTYTEHGAPRQEQLTGQFEFDLGSAHLPPDVFARLLHLAKTATNLCGDCGRALEAEEPFLDNRDEGRCG
jgi:hypothetical protein